MRVIFSYSGATSILVSLTNLWLEGGGGGGMEFEMIGVTVATKPQQQ